MRVSLAVLLASTMLSTAAMAQGAAPFGTPSAPLSAEEKAAIKAEGAERRAAAAAAAEKARKKREAAKAAAAEKVEAPAVIEAPAPTALETAPALTPMEDALTAPAIAPAMGEVPMEPLVQDDMPPLPLDAQ